MKVSVVIPTRDRAALLRECLRGVSSQTIRDMEIIVVDDASSDGTAAVLRSAQDQRLRCVRLSVPSGAPRARAAGLALCRGEFVAFLDDDDVWRPRKLERQLAALARGGGSASHTDFDVVDSRGRSLYVGCRSSRLPPPARAPDALNRLVALYRKGHVEDWPTALFSSVMLRRSVLRSLGGIDLRFRRLHDDTDLWLRVCRNLGPERIDYVAEALVRYRFHPGQISVPQTLQSGGRERTRRLFDARIDNTLFLHKVDSHSYCGKREHVCRRVNRGRFTVLPALAASGGPSW